MLVVAESVPGPAAADALGVGHTLTEGGVGGGAVVVTVAVGHISLGSGVRMVKVVTSWGHCQEARHHDETQE